MKRKFIVKLLEWSGEKDFILTLLVKKLFNTIGFEDILTEDINGNWIIGDKILTDVNKKLLIAEAKQLLSSKLWNVLQTDVKYQANKKMFVLSESIPDITMGKSWVYVLDCFKTRLESLTNESGYFNRK